MSENKEVVSVDPQGPDPGPELSFEDRVRGLADIMASAESDIEDNPSILSNHECLLTYLADLYEEEAKCDGPSLESSRLRMLVQQAQSSIIAMIDDLHHNRG
jgi:hypothetical protein